MTESRMSGGCQCGAVRYTLREEPREIGICHCRMCQKATGAPFFASFTVRNENLVWTRGTPAVFRSSAKMERGFCRDCGTPLYNNWTANEVIHPALATLDEPARLRPEFQIGMESRLPWTEDIGSLRGMSTAEIFAGYEQLLDEIRMTNRQHPDHDTGAWPEGGGS